MDTRVLALGTAARNNGDDLFPQGPVNKQPTVKERWLFTIITIPSVTSRGPWHRRKETKGQRARLRPKTRAANSSGCAAPRAPAPSGTCGGLPALHSATARPSRDTVSLPRGARTVKPGGGQALRTCCRWSARSCPPGQTCAPEPGRQATVPAQPR